MSPSQSLRERGYVETWFPSEGHSKGYGFVRLSSGDSIFCHVRHLPQAWQTADGQQQLQGQSCELTPSQDPHGRPCAIDVVIVAEGTQT